MNTTSRRPARAALPLLLAAAPATAQVPAPIVWSIQWTDATVAQVDSLLGVPITEADLLGTALGVPAFGPLQTPAIVFTGGDLGLAQYNACLGHPPGFPCGIEVDALSTGQDAPFLPPAPGGVQGQPELWFAVDEWALGRNSSAAAAHPSVFTEAPFGDSSADVFAAVDLGLPPLPPTLSPYDVGVLDGDGLPSGSGFVYFGLGTIEPNPPTRGPLDPGDDLDALDIGFQDPAPGGLFPGLGIFFSLDAAFPDALNNHPNSGSAVLQGARGADVLRATQPGVTPLVYAPALALGLDLFGPGTDDLDALIVSENGVDGYQPSQEPYDWAPGPGGAQTDMLLFSVRRGSAVIGRPDSIFGLPIEEGDVLTTPLPTALGGVSPFPGMFIAAENLGLRTARLGALNGDDVNALDATEDVCFDCNMNGVEDSADIAAGTSADVNKNGIPDECEGPILSYCACPELLAPCGNDEPDAGCTNSTGKGARLEVLAGGSSAGADDLTLGLEDLPPSQFALLYMGEDAIEAPFGAGLRCVGPGPGGVHRFMPKTTGGIGFVQYGPGLGSYSCINFPAGGCIAPGDRWRFQGWYRDPGGPCGSFNFTAALQVEFGP